MQTISADLTEGELKQYPIASAGDRLLACILDLVIKVGYVFLMGTALFSSDVDAFGPYFVFLALPWALYHLLFEIFMNGQSPGKRVFRIQIVRLDGTRPSASDYILRWTFGIVDFYVLTGIVALLVIAISGKGQRIGDMVAGTCVVKLNPYATPPRQGYIPVFPQVALLDGSDIKLMVRAIEANSEYENSQPALMVAEKFKELLQVQTSLPASDFLNTLIRDYKNLKGR